MSKKSKWRDLIDGKPVEVSFDMEKLKERRTVTPHVNCRCSHMKFNGKSGTHLIFDGLITAEGLLPFENQKYKLNKRVLIS